MPSAANHERRRIVRIDCATITDRVAFHAVFAAALGFPGYYGNNMDAWVDVMSDPGIVGIKGGGSLVLVLAGAEQFKAHLNDVWCDLIECTGLANRRWLDSREPTFIVLAFD